MDPIQFDPSLVIDHVTHLLIAYILAVPLGWDREKSGATSACEPSLS